MHDHLSIEVTSDGSKTIFNSLVGENYHSKHGALQEALHVFVDSGLNYFHQKNQQDHIAILEIGFGTGLNYLLSADYCMSKGIKLDYTGIEAFPVPSLIIEGMNYKEYLKHPSLFSNFIKQYSIINDQWTMIDEDTVLQIIYDKILDYQSDDRYDIIYFDAFAPVHDPEMWTHEVLKHCCSFLKDKGIFVTYSVTGNLKRSLKNLGFEIERPQGAAGKREMMRATKNS